MVELILGTALYRRVIDRLHTRIHDHSMPFASLPFPAVFSPVHVAALRLYI